MGIWVGLAGLALFGCAATEAQTNATPAATVPAVVATAPSSPASPSAQTPLSDSPSAQQSSDDRFGLSTRMLYRDARTQLMQQGWQPHTQGDAPNLSNPPVRALFELGYAEVKDCAGTGMGLCRFEFTNDSGELLVVSAKPEGADERDRTVWQWFIEATSTAASTSAVFVEGFYVLGGTDQGLEISGDQYRYYDKMGTQEWQPVSDLTHIRDGLVFDGRLYWCIPTESAPGVCTENGWNSFP